MTALPKATIKTYFETGDKPTQSQFIDLIDSYQNVNSTLTTLASATVNPGGLLLLARTSAQVSDIGLTLLGAATSAAALNAISAAPIASPAFTGTPTAVTPSSGDNSTKLATTAFVNTAITSAATSLQKITAFLSADVNLTNTATYFDGPSIAQGSSGTWFVSGTITLIDTAGAATFIVRLWDGTTNIASTVVDSNAANKYEPVSLNGYMASPAGNLRISVKDTTSTSGKILSDASTLGKDSTISAIKIS